MLFISFNDIVLLLKKEIMMNLSTVTDTNFSAAIQPAQAPNTAAPISVALETIKIAAEAAENKVTAKTETAKKKKKKKKPVQISSDFFQQAIEQLSFKKTKQGMIHDSGLDPVSFMTNEHSNEILTIGTAENPRQGSVMLAVSGMSSLNLLSKLNYKEKNFRDVKIEKIKFCIFVDLNPKLQKFWNDIANTIKNTNGVHATYQALVKLMSSKIYTKENERMILEKFKFEAEIAAGRSWLSSLERYKVIKELFDNKGFCFKLMDLTDPVSMQLLVDKLKQLKLKIGLARLSNVREYAEHLGHLKSFHKAMQILAANCHEDEIIFETWVRPGGKNPFLEESSTAHPLSERILVASELLDTAKTFPSSPPFKKGKGFKEKQILYPELEKVMLLGNISDFFEPKLNLAVIDQQADKKEKVKDQKQ